MQPAAAEINRTQRIVANRPGASAEPLARFDQQTIDTGVLQSPARGHTSRATPDNHHLGIAIRHALFCDIWKERTAAPSNAQPETEARHDPEKWIPVFGKDHAPTKGEGASRPDGKKELSFWPSPRLATTERTHHRKIRCSHLFACGQCRQHRDVVTSGVSNGTVIIFIAAAATTLHIQKGPAARLPGPFDSI
jgi:hypothetical protein